MKKVLILASSALLLLAGCAKETLGLNGQEGGLQTVSFTAQMAGDATKAAADGDGAAASVNRCIMEIYYNDALYGRQVQPVSDTKATFTMQVVSNRTYKVAFWADNVTAAGSTPTSAELEVDKYYTTNGAKGLQEVALKGTYAGNLDARDAFFHSGSYTVAQGGTNIDVTLKRPFAQINVITTDWDKVTTVSDLQPTTVDVTVKNPYTVFNAVTGDASTTVETINYKAAVYAPAASGNEKTLSMDYLFAAAEKQVIDIDFKAQKSGNTDVTHAFTSVPYQRNYRTNIKGALLTTTGKWNVTVDPVWEGGHAQIVEVADIKSANEQIAANTDKTILDVKFSAKPNDSGKPTGTPSSTSRAILTTPLAEGSTLSVEVQTNTDALYVGDYKTEYNVDNIETSTTKAAVVNINVPSGATIGTLVINAPSKTVFINGKQVASVGSITNLDAITSDNTLVIEANQSVGTLTLRQGAVKIHGSVNTVVVDVAPGKHVYVRDCEGLSQSVYDVLAPYIDIDNGYIGEKEAGKSTYRIYQGAAAVAKIGDKVYYSLQSAFTAASAETVQTIELLGSCSVSSAITVDKSVNLDIKNHTLTAACSGYIFDINPSTTGKTFKITGTDKDNCGHIISNGTSGHSGVACINASSAAVTFDMNAVKVHGATEADAYNAGSVIISDNSEERGDLIKLTDVSIKGNQDIVSGSAGRAYASIDVKGGVYNSTKRGFRFCGAAASSSVIDGADITTANGIAVYAFSVAILKNSTISMTSGSNNDAVACSRAYNNDAVLTIEETDITVTAGSGSDKPASAIASETKGVVIVISGTFENKNASTYVVKVSTSGGVINFQGGTVIAQEGQTTMFANTQAKHDDSQNPSKINITGGIIYGNCGVSSDNARVEINGGTFKDPITLHVQASQHVSIMPGCTAVFEGKVTSTQTTVVTIPAGTFKKAIAEGDLKSGSTITGGTFYEAAPYSGYIASGYISKAQGTTPETWKIVADPMAGKVAKIGEVGYSTLQDAFSAVKANETITLLENVTLGTSYTYDNPVAITKSGVVLDLNDKTITSSKSSALQVKGTSGTSVENVIIKNGYLNVVDGNVSVARYAICSEYAANFKLQSVQMNGGANISTNSTAVFDDCTIYLDLSVAGSNYYAIYVREGANVTILGGNYTATNNGSVVNLKEGTTATIKGGTFYGNPVSPKNASQACYYISGGSFKFQTDAYWPLNSTADWIIIEDGYTCSKWQDKINNVMHQFRTVSKSE